MVEQTSQIRRRSLGGLVDPWSLGALVIAAVVLMPILSVAWIALSPGENIWPHLLATSLPRYLGNTLILMLSVGVLTAMVGTGAAWLVVMYRFPGHGVLQWALLLPLAIPAYIGAYALVDFLEYAGPVQSGLRALFGWHSARDYWFPEIRSRISAVIVLSASLYPYVYILARTAFREQSVGVLDVARALGCGPWSAFWRVGLPLARPAIAAAAAIVMMETANDFGTVEYFAVQTLTTGIFTTWLEASNVAGAAQIAMTMLVVIFLLVALEKISRRRIRFHRTTSRQAPIEARDLHGPGALAAFLLCLIPFAVGFALPAGVIGWHAMDSAGIWADPELYRALGNTLWVGGLAAVLTVLGGIFLVYGVRLSGRRLPAMLLPATTIGYAAPGAVLGIGLMIPLAGLDQRVADFIEATTGHDPGLILTGSAAAIVLAYFVRFFAIAQGAADAAMGRISPSLPMASRSLGQTAAGTLVRVYMPMIRGSVATALLLVFVDSVKELPATLLLRPFNFNTLATRVYDQASLENLGDAAPAAVIVMAVGFVAVLLLARSSR
ncbi:MAG: iron ABC transporter permease [Paracoccaceae bacterium]|nr:iron ABC transporter permease [Paracoccaceae bacterium]